MKTFKNEKRSTSQEEIIAKLMSKDLIDNVSDDLESKIMLSIEKLESNKNSTFERKGQFISIFVSIIFLFLACCIGLIFIYLMPSNNMFTVSIEHDQTATFLIVLFIGLVIYLLDDIIYLYQNIIKNR